MKDKLNIYKKSNYNVIILKDEEDEIEEKVPDYKQKYSGTGRDYYNASDVESLDDFIENDLEDDVETRLLFTLIIFPLFCVFCIYLTKSLILLTIFKIKLMMF